MTGLDAFFRNLENAKKEILEECEMVAHETAAHMERYAKENRKWTDRTPESGARANLKGKARRTKKEISAEIRQDLYGVYGDEYGYWLENAERFHGNYAILKPTRDACQEIDIRVNFLTRVFCKSKKHRLVLQTAALRGSTAEADRMSAGSMQKAMFRLCRNSTF